MKYRGVPWYYDVVMLLMVVSMAMASQKKEWTIQGQAENIGRIAKECRSDFGRSVVRLIRLEFVLMIVGGR